jgi:hypothetical protein
MYRLIILTFVLFSGSLNAAITLFGQDLNRANRDEMRSAVRKAGAVLIKEAGKDGYFDEYGSGKILKGSSKLYLGYVKKSNSLAFVEYQFNGLNHPELIQKLTKKYGKPKTTRAKFQSDRRYQWTLDGVKVLIYQDWALYKTRLIYFLPQNLTTLRQEYQQSKASPPDSRLKDSEQVY